MVASLAPPISPTIVCTTSPGAMWIRLKFRIATASRSPIARASRRPMLETSPIVRPPRPLLPFEIVDWGRRAPDVDRDALQTGDRGGVIRNDVDERDRRIADDDLLELGVHGLALGVVRLHGRL